MAVEILIVDGRITIEAYFPFPASRQTNAVILPGLVPEIGQDDDIITLTALIPPMPGNDLLFIVQMKDIQVRACESCGKTLLIGPKADEIGVELEDA